jgi:hypothetical protein
MTFDPVIPWAILAVVVVALLFARLVTLRQVLAARGAHRRRALLRWGAMTSAVALLLLACTRPALVAAADDADQQGAGADTNVFVVADRTVDARADISALIERYPRARFAVITFDPGATLVWPLSEDLWSLPSAVSALVALPPPEPVQRDPAGAGNILRYQLIQADQQYPGSANLVVYAGAGTPGSQAPQHDLDVLAATVDGGAVFGYPVDGELAEPTLRRIAGELGVPFENRAGGGELPRIEERRSAADAAATAAVSTAGRTELYWLAALLAAALLLGEIWVSVRELRSSRVARRDVIA